MHAEICHRDFYPASPEFKLTRDPSENPERRRRLSGMAGPSRAVEWTDKGYRGSGAQPRRSFEVRAYGFGVQRLQRCFLFGGVGLGRRVWGFRLRKEL